MLPCSFRISWGVRRHHNTPAELPSHVEPRQLVSALDPPVHQLGSERGTIVLSLIGSDLLAPRRIDLSIVTTQVLILERLVTLSEILE